MTDIERSQNFYTELFGWEFTDVFPRGSHGIQTLHFFTNPAKSINGALLLLDKGMVPKSAGPDAWGLWPTIVVSDVAEAITKVEAMSGGVKTPRLELPGGRGVIGHVMDPDGNVLGLWSQA